jgi:hypothetical protein
VAARQADMWQIISKASGAIALTLFTVALDSMRDMAKDLSDLKVTAARISEIMAHDREAITHQDARITELERLNGSKRYPK